jgi:hypothetical protein
MITDWDKSADDPSIASFGSLSGIVLSSSRQCQDNACNQITKGHEKRTININQRNHNPAKHTNPQPLNANATANISALSGEIAVKNLGTCSES